MPRYYFNLYRDGTKIPDDEGLELQDDSVAKREARESLRDVITEALSGEFQPIAVTVEVVKDGVGSLERLTGQLVVHERI